MMFIYVAIQGTAKFFSTADLACYIPIGKCTSIPISVHPHQYFLFFLFLIIAILVVMKWYLIVALICIFLKTVDV